MHRSLRPILAVSALALLAACSQKEEEVVQQPDANPAATIPTPANESAAPDFVEKAAVSDMFEVESSKVAIERTKNPEVKAFAQMMVEMHTKTTADLKTALASSGLTLTPPAALPQDKLDAIAKLKAADAAMFDKDYLNAQVDGHQAALDLMQRYANDGDNATLKAAAAATAPVVQAHYDQAKALRDKLN